MARITVDVDEALLRQAQEVMGTETKVATINAALAQVIRRVRVAAAIEAMNSVTMDYSASSSSFRDGGGRDLAALEERARQADPDIAKASA